MWAPLFFSNSTVLEKRQKSQRPKLELYYLHVWVLLELKDTAGGVLYFSS